MPSATSPRPASSRWSPRWRRCSAWWPSRGDGATRPGAPALATAPPGSSPDEGGQSPARGKRTAGAAVAGGDEEVAVAVPGQDHRLDVDDDQRAQAEEFLRQAAEAPLVLVEVAGSGDVRAGVGAQ